MKVIYPILVLMGLFSFFGCKEKSKTDEKSPPMVLNDSTMTRLRAELKRDAGKPFGTEWIRTTDLERKIVDQYGFEGIQLIYESFNSARYYNHGQIPADCPWHSLNGLSIEEAIATNFAPIQKKLPTLVAAMQDRCEFIYAEKTDSLWRLHYCLKRKLHDGRDYFIVYTGGPSLQGALPNANLQAFNWTIPQDLKEFYAIHDGFGEFLDANFILASDQLRVLGEMMNPIAKEEGTYPEGYKFDDLLPFFPDGSGNSQCFLRTAKGNNTTVDWDHEIWEISEEVGFFEFIDERMSELDEE